MYCSQPFSTKTESNLHTVYLWLPHTYATLLSMLAFKNVTVAYGSTQVLKDASFQASPKDCVCIVGASGSGKSTIAKLLVRVLDPDDGVVMVDGADLKAVPPGILQLFRRRVGIISKSRCCWNMRVCVKILPCHLSSLMRLKQQ